MNKWVLLEHKVYSASSFDIHYDFVVDNLDSDCFRYILDGKLLYGLFEISGNSCRLIKNI